MLPVKCRTCDTTVLTLAGGVEDSGLECTSCRHIFCDNCYDTGMGDGCHCHPDGLHKAVTVCPFCSPSKQIEAGEALAACDQHGGYDLEDESNPGRQVMRAIDAKRREADECREQADYWHDLWKAGDWQTLAALRVIVRLPDDFKKE